MVRKSIKFFIFKWIYFEISKEKKRYTTNICYEDSPNHIKIVNPTNNSKTLVKEKNKMERGRQIEKWRHPEILLKMTNNFSAPVTTLGFKDILSLITKFNPHQDKQINGCVQIVDRWPYHQKWPVTQEELHDRWTLHSYCVSSK